MQLTYLEEIWLCIANICISNMQRFVVMKFFCCIATSPDRGSNDDSITSYEKKKISLFCNVWIISRLLVNNLT